MSNNIASVFDDEAFDATQHEDQQSFEQLPKGEYIFEVIKGEVRETKNKQGVGANFEFEVLDGQFTGQKYFQWYNLRHANEIAEKIGQQQFASLCKACGVPLCKDTDELLGRKFIGKIGPQKKDPTANEFKGYGPVEGMVSAPRQSPPAQPQQVANTTSQPAQAATKAGGKMPWQR